MGIPLSTVDSSFQWLPGDPKWEQIYFVSSLAVSSVTAFVGALALLSLAAQAGLLSLSAGSDTWFGTGLHSTIYVIFAAACALLDLTVVSKLPAHHAGAMRIGVSRTGVAFRLRFRIRFIPWSNLRWESENTLAVKIGGATVRIELTQNQVAGVQGVLHRPLS